MAIVRVALFLLLAVGLSWYQLRALIRDGDNWPAAVYLILMATAAAIGSALAAGYRLPSPHVPLEAAFKPVGQWLFGGG